MTKRSVQPPIDWPRRLKIFALVTSLALTVFIPWPIVKILAAFGLIIFSRQFNFIYRPYGIILLGSLFALAYILSPYWFFVSTLKNSIIVQTLGPQATMVIAAFGLSVIGAVWAYLSAGDIPLSSSSSNNGKSLWRRIVPVTMLALIVLVCNYPALQNNVPVLGDESYHITRVRFLHSFLWKFFGNTNTETIIAISFVIIAGIFLWLKRFRTQIIFLAACVTAFGVYFVITVSGTPGVASRMDMLRYPLVSCWFQNLWPIWSGNACDERMFRIIPLVSAFGICWFAWWSIRKQNIPPIIAFVSSLAFVLTPNIYYYSTILYLEMPAVTLLLLALYFIEPILTEEFKSARCSPGWYALMAAGFIKETLLPIIIGIIVLRVVVRAEIIYKTKSLNIKTILDEITAAFCIGAPLGVYLLLLSVFGKARDYAFSYSNLTNPDLYIVAAKALWKQFGVMLPLAIGGLMVSLLRRRFIFIFSTAALFLIHFFFHFLDSADLVGLARFNLFFFSILAMPAIIFLGWLGGKSRLTLMAAAALYLITNVVLSPVAITGEKNPAWSSQLNKATTDYYFPLEDVVKWLQANRPKIPIGIGGAYGDSNILWYFNKMMYHPPIVQSTISPEVPYLEGLKNTIALAHQKGISLLVWHKMQGRPVLTDAESMILDYKAIKVFSNHYLAIILYEKQVPSIIPAGVNK